MHKKFPKRPRLAGFDYSSSGYYFVTVVTLNREMTLGQVEHFDVVLSYLGQLVEDVILDLPRRHPHIELDGYVIMPNHIHVLFRFNDTDKPVTLSRLINELKSKTTVFYNKRTANTGTVWQYTFHDVIMRSDEQLYATREYIANNPIQWELDEYNPEQVTEHESDAAGASA